MDRADYMKMQSRILAKAWSDPIFKQQLLKNPKAVAAEYGLPVPEGIEIRVVENTPNLIHVVLPSKPAEDLLSEDQLEALVGGAAIREPPPPPIVIW